MPVSRQTAEGMSQVVAETYARAEVRLLSLIAKHLEAGVGSPQWAEAKLAELQLFRRRAAGVVDAAHAEAVGQLMQLLQQAYLRGAAAGQGDLDAAGVELELPPQHAERAVQALARATVGTLDGLRPMVLRQVDDAYRRAVVRAVAGTITGAATRLQDAQVALDDLARQGVSGFTDKAGRRWGLATYTEMATRSATAQAAVNGHLDRLEQAGIPLVIVSNSSRECELCRPWEGKVLARGPIPAIVGNAVTGESMRVQVDGTLAEAMSAGLMHPNCTHNLSAFIPGATKVPTATGNAEGYAEKQQQRALERHVREWKRRQAVAVTPEAKRLADGKVREWQGAVKAHTDRTGLPRKREREQLNRAR